MNCLTAQNSLSAHLDGFLSGKERRSLVAHLETCPSCESRRTQMLRLRSALRGLPAEPPPAHLSTALRVMASKEHQRALARLRHFDSTADSLRLWFENLMRPLALPFAGGLVIGATALWHALADLHLASRRWDRYSGGAVHRSLDQNRDRVSRDGQRNRYRFHHRQGVGRLAGRMVDYSLPKGSGLENHPEIRRALENKLLLFTQFTPATHVRPAD